jgi:hypothetical protein
MIRGVNWDTILQDVDPRRNGGRVFNNTPLDEDENLNTGHEGAMARLTGRQSSALENLKDRATIRRSVKNYSRQDSLDEIAAYLREKYEQNPVRNERGQAIGFDNLHLISAAKRKELQRNVFHTAFRYLFLKPNPLGNIDARWATKVYRDAYGTLHTTEYTSQNPYMPTEFSSYTFVGTEPSISENEWNDIDNIWNAIKDQEVPLAEGYNQDSAKERFAQTLADLGRAHNWDQTRQVQKMVWKNGIQQLASIEEGYDDETADQYSCGGGVKRRLTQIVMIVLQDTPDTRPLNGNDMARRFTEQMISSKPEGNSVFNVIDRMTLQQLKDAKDGLEKKFIMFDNLTPAQEAALKQLEWWNTADIQDFIQDAKNFYGVSRIKDNLTVKARYRDRPFDNYGLVIVKLAQDALGNNYEPINDRMDTRINELEQAERVRLERERQEREQQARVRQEARAREALERQQAEVRRMAEITRQVQADLLRGQQAAIPASSSAKPAPKSALPGFQLHRSGVPVAIDKTIGAIFKSMSGRNFKNHMARFPEAVNILNMYSKETAQKLEGALNKNASFFDRLRVFAPQDLNNFLLEFSFAHKQIILLSEQSELFMALIMSNPQAQHNFNELSYEQVRRLDAKLSNDFIERYAAFKPEQQARFFRVWQEKQKPTKQLALAH